MKEVNSAYDAGVEYSIVPPVFVPDDVVAVESLTAVLSYAKASELSPVASVVLSAHFQTAFNALSHNLADAPLDVRDQAYSQLSGRMVRHINC